MASYSFAVVHGPNLNLLGSREPEVYGSRTLEEINSDLAMFADAIGINLGFFQSNHEGALIDHIQGLRGKVDGVLINAAALTHTSVGLRDALLASELPFVEVHLSNVFARESFRHTSTLSDIALGVVTGFGPQSYELGLRGLLLHATER